MLGITLEKGESWNTYIANPHGRGHRPSAVIHRPAHLQNHQHCCPKDRRRHFSLPLLRERTTCSLCSSKSSAMLGDWSQLPRNSAQGKKQPSNKPSTIRKIIWSFQSLTRPKPITTRPKAPVIRDRNCRGPNLRAQTVAIGFTSV